MRGILAGFVLLFVFLPNIASAADWYVRPAGGSYGNEDGMNYTNAWDGLGNIVWGAGGVDAGDTLYVCGLHLRNHTGGSKGEKIIVDVSGTENNRITIRGDCPSDPGIIWGAGIISYDTWTDEGGGVYSITIGGNYDGSSFFFEDITADNWTVLKKADNLTECQNTPGSQYSPDYVHQSTLYVHTSDGLRPEGRIAGNRDGYKLSIDDTSYITWKDLETYTINRWLDYSSSPPGWITYHIFDNVTFLYASSGIMTMRQGSHHNVWKNCEFGWAENGIGGAASPHGNGSLSPHDVIISNCTFHDIGVYVGDSDAHAIAWQGGYNNTLENNEMYNVGSGITIYGYPDQGFWNYTIRWNRVHNTHTIDGANGRGIELNNDANGIYTGNKVYGNIVTDCDDTAYRTKTTDMSYFYNNVAKNCRYGIYLLGSAGTSLKATLRNNIFYNVTYNIWWSTGAMNPGEYVLDSDYNLFYPETGEKLRFADDATSDTYDFAGWQALSKPNCIFDPNSLTLDPLFVNPGNRDFHLQAGSPAIDNGTDVGLTLDFEGTPIPQPPGGDPDIGAYEYVSGSPPQTCSDGTLYEACSSTQPQYCDDGNLVDDCDTCLCPGGYSCQTNGSCQLSGGYGDLSAWYRFDENSGNIAGDSSGNGNDGTIYDASWTSDSISGYALEFDGADDYVVVPHNTGLDPDGYGPFSVSLWFKAKETTSGNHYLIDKYYNTDRWRVYFYDGGNGRIRVFLRTEGTDPDSEAPVTDSDYDDDAWHHFCFTLENNDYIKIYIDGVNVKNSSGLWTGYFDFNIRDLHIGRDSSYSGSYFNGKIDEVRIYSKALTPEEITEHYNEVKADLNNDGEVDIQDLVIIATNFGKTSGYDSESDTDNSGEVDVFDMVFVASRFT